MNCFINFKLFGLFFLDFLVYSIYSLWYRIIKPKGVLFMAYKDTNLEYISQTQTLIGTKNKTYIDTETGEYVECIQQTKRFYGTQQFYKVFLADLLQMLGILESKPLDVLCYIIDNTNPSNNLFVGTYERIMKDTGISKATIAKVMTRLQAGGYIKKLQNGVYFVSPKVIIKGNDNKKRTLVIQYEAEDPMNEINKPKKGIKRATKPLLNAGAEEYEEENPAGGQAEGEEGAL